MQGNQNRNYTTIPKLTPEEREKCIREGRCFKCREKGHNSNNCQKFKNNTSSTSNSQNIRAAGVLTFPMLYPQFPIASMNPEQYYTPQQTPAVHIETSTQESESKTTTPGKHAANIRAILQGLTEDQREELYQSLDKEGF